MVYKWPETITIKKAKLLADNVLMHESYKLTLDAFIRRKVDHGHETLFHGTDGGSFTTFRCGGRLPAVFVSPGTTDNNFRNEF